MPRIAKDPGAPVVGGSQLEATPRPPRDAAVADGLQEGQRSGRVRGDPLPVEEGPGQASATLRVLGVAGPLVEACGPGLVGREPAAAQEQVAQIVAAQGAAA